MRSAPPSTNVGVGVGEDRKSTRLNSSHLGISYAVFCLKKKKDDGQSRHRRTSESGRRARVRHDVSEAATTTAPIDTKQYPSATCLTLDHGHPLRDIVH